jgi:predicted alpha/beta hydrolase family esterase
MKKVFILHGFEGAPNGGWRPWLMAELQKHDIYACTLPMPSPSTPVLSEWLDELKRHIDRNHDDDIYLVGHSLGGAVILRYLERYDNSTIQGIVLVSAPCHPTTNPHLIDFLNAPFDFTTIASRIKKTVVIHGDDDPVVPFTDAKCIAQELHGKLVAVPQGKHLNGSAGFTQLEECRDELLAIIGE